MPGALVHSQKPPPTEKKKFGTVRGIGAAIKDSSGSLSNQITQSWSVGRDALPLNRRSRDTAPGDALKYGYVKRRKHRAVLQQQQQLQQPSATDVEFFETSTSPSADSFVLVESMKHLDARYPRRPPVRIDHQDGPWTVSVAETPHDPHSYSLYVKTPTHNLTLTRTAVEIVELHHKLRESLPGMAIPDLPLDPSTIPRPPSTPPKRKSNFLHTLSRLASPQRSPRSVPSRTPTNVSTPLASPSQELVDPFLTSDLDPSPSRAALVDGSSANNSSTITGLAAYLTTISNTADLRQARVWKRFVRVRTDDLESVRAERAIKRVRSDVAAHVIPKPTTPTTANEDMAVEEAVGERTAVAAIVHKSKEEEHLERIEETKAEEAPLEADDKEMVTVDSSMERTETQEEEQPRPPSAAASLETAVAHAVATVVTATTAPAAISRVRSQSADPDKSSRVSRAYVDSTTDQTTGDESSTSTTGLLGDQSFDRRRRTPRKKQQQQAVAKKMSHRKVVIDDFEMLRVLGKGCAGKVLLVRHKPTSELYALKAITKRHVLAHQELQHTLTEQAVLKRMAAEGRDPFVVKLWWSFHDKENLFLVMDFHPGGDLATQLARWGRLGRDRARFYAAEIVEGVEGLHAAGVIYRDLKPENILIGADGHIVLTDFGLSKEFPRSSSVQDNFFTDGAPAWMKVTEKAQPDVALSGPPSAAADSTSTFCGTAEYLAPEVIQGLNYSYEVDWWSFGTMLFEMLTGITPFWANNHSDMYVRVLQDELQFPDDRAIDQDTKSLIRGLLQRNPALRMCEPRIKRHPYFSMIDWSHVYYKRYIPPYIPPIDPSNASDTQNFDDTFLDMEPVINDGEDHDQQTDTDPERGEQTDTDRTDGDDSNTTPSRSRSSSITPAREPDVDVFDGYSFKGRHSIILDGEEEEEGEEGAGEEEEEVKEEVKEVKEMEEEVEEEVEEVKEQETKQTDEEGKLEDVRNREIALEPPELEKPSADDMVNGEVIEATEAAEAPEHKTPEARPTSLPETSSDDKDVNDVTVEDSPPLLPSKDILPETTEAETAAPPLPPKAPRPTNILAVRSRREKSGIPALDRYLSDNIDEDEAATEREEEDDDWDLVEAGLGEDRNGAKGTSLFARGVVDKYRLAVVFRKASSPSYRPAPRSFSAMSKDSTTMDRDPPSPESRRRGRLLRKSPREFLQPKSPKKSGPKSPPTTPNSSLPTTSVTSRSLKTKESATSVGFSSDNSANGEFDSSGITDTIRAPHPQEDHPKHKTKKLQRYREGAEKMLSLFASPRQTMN